MCRCTFPGFFVHLFASWSVLYTLSIHYPHHQYISTPSLPSGIAQLSTEHVRPREQLACTQPSSISRAVFNSRSSASLQHLPSSSSILAMRFATFALYSLKVNVLNVLVSNQRSNSLNLNFIESSTVHEASVATVPQDEYPDVVFADNMTAVPML